MTPPEFRLCLDLLAWSQRGLARLLGLDDRGVRRWASGQNEIPDNIAHWLATLATFHAKHPRPLKGAPNFKCVRERHPHAPLGDKE